MHERVHAHVPYLRLSDQLEHIIRQRINPEIAFSAEGLDLLAGEELTAQARLLHTAGLATTIHAPFLDLNPGALDHTIREATRLRFRQTFQAARILQPRAIVFHPGYDDLRYGDKRMAWLENSVDFWREFIPIAREIGCTIAVENIFEKEPSTLHALLETVDDPCFRHCFDVGHWNMFTTVTMEDWFAELGPFLAEVHVHDNHGQADEHLPLGEGEIDFDLLFGLVGHYAPHAILTIEAHTPERLERALRNIRTYV
ncbi:sugar phosphate isomerase/epimerase [Geobacter sp. SVR]|uniref:sugar phosphate isomerase/epimerase family protein n=1 Tax=Geobacter sp. SVR TaxID=2495594 RepID=UPI00143EF5B1|nr:sugar phosphate isomerase/epimerase family protein [Geobacter sp. SVR]BCS52473.1 AP endonuclease [Geobacter sp. SVR]GCF84090.1 AP endonuclease [Geobacter sp. SVR]